MPFVPYFIEVEHSVLSVGYMILSKVDVCLGMWVNHNQLIKSLLYQQSSRVKTVTAR